MKWVALISLIAFAGCNNGVKAPIEGRMDPHVPAQVHFTADDLRTSTAVGLPVLTRDSSGILHVTLPIRSTTNQKLYVDYRTTFFDRNNQPMGSDSGWLPKTLPANTPDQITTNAMSPGATDFRIDIRWSE